MQLRLEKLDRGTHEDSLVDFAREFRAEGDDRLALLLSDPDFFFQTARQFEAGLDLPSDRVPMSHFLFFDENRLVGASRLRRAIVPVLLEDGGHIGYEVRKSARGRGFAREILRRTLHEAGAIGLSKVYLTTATDNIPSIRVIEGQAGVFEAETISPRTGQRMRRYVILTG